MVKVRFYKVSEVKVLYVLYFFDWVRIYKEGFYCFLIKVKKKRVLGKRESSRSVFRFYGIR